jgi:hypothetical protein
VAGAIFQTSWFQNGLYRAVHLLVSTRRGQSAGRHGENALAHFPFLQPHRLGGLYHHLHPDWIFFLEEGEITRSLGGANGTLPDFRGDNFHRSRRVFQTFIIQVFGSPFFQKTSAKA